MVIAVTGAGGKTSVIENIALQNADKKVLVTTTTHMYPIMSPVSRQTLVDPTADELYFAVSLGGIVCAGKSAKEGKITALNKNVLSDTINKVNLTLIEADGSRRLPLKLHNETEPVMPQRYDLCVVVAGLSALGKNICDTVHRYELNLNWKENPYRKVGIEDIIYCIEDAVSAANLDANKTLVILNQADNAELKQAGEEISSGLKYRTLVLSLKNGDIITL